MSTVSTVRIITLLVAAGFALSAAHAELAKDEYRTTIDQTFPLKSGGSFALTNRNGSIELDTWDKEEVHIVAEKIMRTDSGGFSWLMRLIGLKSNVSTDEAAQKLFEEFTIDFTGDDSTRTVTTIYPKAEGINFQVIYRITAPRRVVPTIDTVNGAIRVANVEGDTTIDTTNGHVHLSSITGAVHAESTNGRLSIEDTVGSVDAETTNGAVEVSTRADAPISGPIALKSTNGSVGLSVPANAGFSLSLRTVNGSASCDLALTTTTESTRKRLKGVVGTGGPEISLRTTNGSVRIKKRN